MGNQEREKEREEKEGGGGKAEEWEGFHTCASFFPLQAWSRSMKLLHAGPG